LWVWFRWVLEGWIGGIFIVLGKNECWVIGRFWGAKASWKRYYVMDATEGV
jgi:hypothetical protein